MTEEQQHEWNNLWVDAESERLMALHYESLAKQHKDNKFVAALFDDLTQMCCENLEIIHEKINKLKP